MQGPFGVLRQVELVDYEVLKPEHWREQQIYHREWKEPQGWMATHVEETEELGLSYLGSEAGKTPELQVRFGKELTLMQWWELVRLVQSFQDVLQEEPSWARGVKHEIRTPAGPLVREH